MGQMHENEIAVDLGTVKKLIFEQFPEYYDLPITQVNSTGTVNYIFTLGKDLCVRLPRVSEWADIEKQCKWLPYLSPHLSLTVPEPVAVGRPDSSYRLHWAIFKWIDGDIYSDEIIDDEQKAAKDLAQFVNELHSVEVSKNAPKAGRLPLAELDKKTMDSINSSTGLMNADKIIEVWKDSLKSSPWDKNAVWIHADLLRTNLLVHSGRLAAVIDFGLAGIGDPAFDLIPAWSIFTEKGRKVFQDSVFAARDTWIRARGYALHQAALIIPYYEKTNPEFVAQAKRTMHEIVIDANNIY